MDIFICDLAFPHTFAHTHAQTCARISAIIIPLVPHHHIIFSVCNVATLRFHLYSQPPIRRILYVCFRCFHVMRILILYVYHKMYMCDLMCVRSSRSSACEYNSHRTLHIYTNIHVFDTQRNDERTKYARRYIILYYNRYKNCEMGTEEDVRCGISIEQKDKQKIFCGGWEKK